MVTEMIDFIMRGGSNPNEEMDAVERQIVEMAWQRFQTNPAYAKKGLKWNYNWAYFNVFWMTGNPELRDLLFRAEEYPPWIEVEVTTYCNLRCPFCERTHWNEPNQHMSFEQFKSILDQFPKLKWIGLTGIGESFLNKDFIKMLEYVKSKGIYIELYDSFIYTDDKLAKKLVELGIDRIYASFDGATKETYENFRPGSNYETVVSNIVRLDKWKKKLHTEFPEFAFHYIVTKDNIHEVEQYLELLHKLKIDVAFVQYGRMLHNYKEVEDLFVEIPEDVQSKILKKAKELNIKVNWNADLPTTKPPFHHCTAWTMPFIFVDGTIIPCCCLNEQNDREWQRKTSLGNVFEKPFREIWYGEKYNDLRRKLHNKKLPEVCERCPIYELGK
jgi:radical SAM protein with 4Fe4S-binding SPASM domain